MMHVEIVEASRRERPRNDPAMVGAARRPGGVLDHPVPGMPARAGGVPAAAAARAPMVSREDNYAGVFGAPAGGGRRPVVLAVDFIRAYTCEDSPFHAPGVVEAVRAAAPFFGLVRRLGVPLIHTRVLYDRPRPDARVFLAKVPALARLVSGEPLAEFDPAVTPVPGETVLVKQHASAFYGTDLAERLAALGADTVIVTGCTTSGCVRATVVDVMQHGLVPLVPAELVGDRHPEPHAANLFDMNAKYADVRPVAEIAAWLEEVAGRQTAPG